MQKPLQIAWRHMEPSAALEARIRDESKRLEKFCSEIIACHVVVEAPHKHHHQGKIYRVSVDLTVPGKEISAGKAQHDKHAHEDVYVATRDTFNSTQRQLEDYARRRRGEVKHHEEHRISGHVTALFSEDGFGFIEDDSGKEVFFHRNCVHDDAFDELKIGTAVHFVEQQGDEGPQASAVFARA